MTKKIYTAEDMTRVNGWIRTTDGKWVLVPEGPRSDYSYWFNVTPDNKVGDQLGHTSYDYVFANPSRNWMAKSSNLHYLASGLNEILNRNGIEVTE